MSDHLPECVDRICRNPLAEGLTLGEAERMLCCCVELRACEQRIEANNIIIDTLNQNASYKAGYAAGITTAREAAERVGIQPGQVEQYTAVLAAIDALTEDK